MSRLYRRRDRINEDVMITQVLSHYGYNVHPELVEQQFPCDMHGDGHDSKPSGRVYPQSNSFYCFACDVSRDPISTVMEKEGVEFVEAIKVLERRYKLPELPWEEEDKREKPLEHRIGEMVQGGTNSNSFDNARKRVHSMLDAATEDRDLNKPKLLAYWEMYDRFCYEVEKKNWTEQVGRDAMDKLRQRIMNKLRGDHAGRTSQTPE